MPVKGLYGGNPQFTVDTFTVKDRNGNTLLDAATVGTVTASSTTTFTNKTLNCDSTGNVITNIGSSEVKSELITGMSAVSAAVGDSLLISDASDSNNLKKCTVQTIVDLAGGAYASTTLNGTTAFTGLTTDAVYELMVFGVKSTSTGSLYMQVSTDNGSSYLSTSVYAFNSIADYNSAVNRSTFSRDTRTFINLAHNCLATTAGRNVCARYVFNTSTTLGFNITGHGKLMTELDYGGVLYMGGESSTNSVNAFQLYASAGTLSGTAYLKRLV